MPCSLLLKQLADAEDNLESGFESGFDSLVYSQIGLAEILSSLAVTNDNIFHTAGLEHVGADFTGKCAALRPVAVLGADFYNCTVSGFDSGVDVHKGNAAIISQPFVSILESLSLIS
jgi:hypothetical protein